LIVCLEACFDSTVYRLEIPLKSWEDMSRVVSETVNTEGFHRLFVFRVAEAKVFDLSAVFVCLQGPCLEWMWVLVKMRGLWLPYEGLKDLALAYSGSDTMIEIKRRNKQRREEGEEENTRLVKDYILLI
jgi:hypothetical protein